MTRQENFKPYTQGQERFGEWFIKNVGRWQTRVYEATGGRVWNRFLGVQCAILTTTGRKSGQPRKTPLLYLRQGDQVVMVASKGGMTTLPAWYGNLRANPHVEIQIGSEKRRMLPEMPTRTRSACCGRSSTRCTTATRSIAPGSMASGGCRW